MALDTVSDYLTTARVLLQDAAASRYSDPELLVALSLAMLEARKLRADLFIGRASAIPSYTTNNTDPVVMDSQYRVPILYYIVGHAQLRDEEDTQDTRAAALLAKFSTQMLTLS